ncbi:MAG: exodeoxyribonuclease VII small subunit [Rhodocyclaceae bacterium]|jgi:exodeoxyribonuclease VII small subunit|nr:exodeoxyribonuclease VII small subunit [Rhodocyclaceae bacterium]
MNTPAPNSFESSLLELEAIVASLEAGNIPLGDALDAYQRGARLIRQCQNTLAEAEGTIQVLEQNLLREFDAPPDISGGGDL